MSSNGEENSVVKSDHSIEINQQDKYKKKPPKKIPDEIREFLNNNYTVFVGGNGEPKEFSSLGDGFKGERFITQDDISNFSIESLLYLVSFKNPDFILKNFKSGSINYSQI